jgi:very-short-patch-repair endonuclease
MAVSEQHIRKLVEDYENDLRYFLVFAGSESPIEESLYAALYHLSRSHQPAFAMALPGVPLERFGKDEMFGRPAVIIPQLNIGPYRVDFAVLIRDWTSVGDKLEHVIVIECDGHEWHERTPDQAKRDKSRDRYFVENGMAVMRFTGREIWADPLVCARQIENTINNRWIEWATGGGPVLDE